jgi:hypothetical protein
VPGRWGVGGAVQRMASLCSDRFMYNHLLYPWNTIVLCLYWAKYTIVPGATCNLDGRLSMCLSWPAPVDITAYRCP